MKITFIIANPNMSGGVRVCAIYAKKFKQLGHTVNIVSPAKKYLSIKEQLKKILNVQGWVSKEKQRYNHFDLLGLDITYASNVSKLNSVDIPDADIIIATWWKTAEWVIDLPEEKGKKVYFIQHHEIHKGLPVERVKQTYRLPFYKVTIASWLVELMVEKYESTPPFLVPNSVEHTIFNSKEKRKQAVPTIGFLFSEIDFKGVDIALDVIENLKNIIPELRVIAFGSKAPETIGIPNYVELSINPVQGDIRLLYQQCDLWLCCSLIEGFGLTILEAMACRVPCVSTRCGGPEDIISEGINGFLCPVNSVDSLTNAAYKVLNFNDKEWQIFSTAAYEHATNYSWDDATMLFEKTLNNILSDD